MVLPHLLKWNDPSGHTTATLTDNITKFDYVVATVALVNNVSPTMGYDYTWISSSIWMKDSILNSLDYWVPYPSGSKAAGLLSASILADPSGILEGTRYDAYFGFCVLDPTTIRINQSLIEGWSSNSVFHLLSLKGFNV